MGDEPLSISEPCSCSHLFRGVWVHEVQQVDPRCPRHGVGTEWWERNVE